jgi:hypothetical protein
MKFLFLIWGNLKRARLRTLLTVCAILIAFLLFGYLCAIRRALGQPIGMAGAERLMVRHRISIAQLTRWSLDGVSSWGRLARFEVHAGQMLSLRAGLPLTVKVHASGLQPNGMIHFALALVGQAGEDYNATARKGGVPQSAKFHMDAGRPRVWPKEAVRQKGPLCPQYPRTASATGKSPGPPAPCARRALDRSRKVAEIC